MIDETIKSPWLVAGLTSIAYLILLGGLFVLLFLVPYFMVLSF